MCDFSMDKTGDFPMDVVLAFAMFDGFNLNPREHTALFNSS